MKPSRLGLSSPRFIVGGTLILSALAYVQIDRIESADLAQRLQQIVEDDAAQIARSFREAGASAEMIANLFASSNFVSREEFGVFSAAFAQHHGLQAVSWNPLLTSTDRRDFETELAAAYGNQHTITARVDGVMLPAPERAEYLCVQYIWPVQGNELVIGYDSFSNPLRSAAALRARDSGKMAMSAPTTIIQETESSHAVLMFVPCYRHDASVTTVEERRAAFLGCTLAALRVAPIIDNVLATLHQSPQGVNFELRDKSMPAEAGLLFTHRSRVTETSLSLSHFATDEAYAVEFEIGGRVIEMRASGNQYFASIQSSGRLGTLLTTLIALNIVVAFFSRAVVRQRRRADEQTRLLFETETALRTQADLANSAKSQFLAVMSHELRTPMNGVIGLLDVLMQTSLKASQMALAIKIRGSAQVLLVTLNEILDFSKIEANKLLLSNEKLCLEEVILAPCELLNPVARAKGVGFTVFVDPALPREAIGDAARIQQILVNLLSNAIKFSAVSGRRGLISVRAVMEESPDGVEPIWLRIAVRDNGVGMSPEVQASLFRQFEQGSSETARRFGGTGLGLAISQQLAQLMGGKISLTSAIDEGSEFTLRIPLARVPADQRTVVNAARDQTLAGLQCWVVGQDSIITRDVAAYLTHAGAIVRFSTPPTPLPTHEPACWILDAAQSRSLAQVRSAICVFIGHDPSTPPASASKYFVLMRGLRRKPRFLAENILELDIDMATGATIVNAVALLSGRVEAVVEREPSANDGSTSTAVNQRLHAQSEPQLQVVVREEELRRGRLILVAEDNETNQEVIRLQLAVLGYAADIVEDGKQALELWRTGRYALVIADIQMPVMDGHELTMQIRADESRAGQRPTPIIAMTANALPSEHVRCLASGADEFITKPVLLDALRDMLARRMPASLALASGIPSTRVVGVDDTIAIDLLSIQRTLRLSHEKWMELTTGFQKRAETTAQQIGAAVLDGRLLQARAFAHKLGGAAGNFNARRLMTLCATLEHTHAAEGSEEVRMMAVEITREVARVSAQITEHFRAPSA